MQSVVSMVGFFAMLLVMLHVSFAQQGMESMQEDITGMQEQEQVSQQEQEQLHPLIVAALENNFKNLEQLLRESNDVNVNIQNPQGWSPLILAVDKGHFDIAQRLLIAGADVNLQENDGWTALMLAAYQGNLPMIDLLLDAGADPLLSNSNGYGPHSIAHFQQQQQASRRIADAGLLTAMSRFQLPAMLLLLQDGADANLRNTQGWTPLMFFSTDGFVDGAQQLLSRADCDVNAQENDGWTALMFAANNRHVEIVQQLLDHGADPHLRAVQGFSALELAQDRGIEDVVRVFADRGLLTQQQSAGKAAAGDDDGKKKKWGLW